MSTRACYVFKHENQNDVRKNDITIYKHHDGYPAGAISWIKAAKDYGNKLPADEFGENLIYERDKMVTGFMACPEITNSAKWFTDNYKDHGDLSYHYVIYGDTTVEIWQHNYYVVGDKIEDKVELIFLGSIDEAVKKYVPDEEVA
jgi:hypothetical protein